MKALETVQFAAILATALALVPGLAHVLELRNKIHMPRETYLIVQRIYRGWALFAGAFAVAALTATFVLAQASGRQDIGPAYAAFALIVASQVVFWALTFPVNRRTRNWSDVPDDWSALRRRWEYSHAFAALLHLIALACVAWAVVY